MGMKPRNKCPELDCPWIPLVKAGTSMDTLNAARKLVRGGGFQRCVHAKRVLTDLLPLAREVHDGER